jgi:succinoglycan biosynthesis transport protein ExoP
VERPNELLASVPREDLFNRLMAEFDMVILDTPPASFLSDSLLLAPLVDAVVMVVRDGAVSRRLVLDTVDRLKQVEAPIAGVIVNAVQTGRGSARYNYYYYGYGYGGYGYGYSNYIDNEKAKDS